ncbi:MAG: aromatic hydrocarbon degradation protein [Gammaproteobacteria bacterium]|nr:aromatic hydrocarbon degradation protein [Gammaproteobacteria bacterium]
MSHSRNHYRKLLLGGLAALASPGLVQASGFALIENGGSGQGNAYAGAAAHAVDASTVFFNPAGMMQLDGDSLSVAGHFIKPDSKFTNDGSTAAAALGSPALGGSNDDGGFNALVPNLYWVKGINDQTKFGLGVQTLFGLATKYDDDWVGRYHGVESDLKTININPSLAYRVNDKLSIGGGIDVLFGDIVFTNAIDFGAICAAQGVASASCSPQQTDGFADLEGDNLSDPAFGFNFGLQYLISEQTTFGLSYRSEIDLDLEGEADFTVPAPASFVMSGGLFLDSDIEAGVTLPASLALSVAHKVDDFTWLADITWTGWSSFDELKIEYENDDQPDSVTTEDWDDTFRYSVGFDYQYADDMILRSGIALDETPVPSSERRTPRLPGDSRTWLSFGLTYLWDDDLTIDVGYSHLFIDDTKINNEFESSVPTLAANLKGEYEASVDILSVQLNWQY